MDYVFLMNFEFQGCLRNITGLGTRKKFEDFEFRIADYNLLRAKAIDCRTEIKIGRTSYFLYGATSILKAITVLQK